VRARRRRCSIARAGGRRDRIAFSFFLTRCIGVNEDRGRGRGVDDACGIAGWAPDFRMRGGENKSISIVGWGRIDGWDLIFLSNFLFYKYSRDLERHNLNKRFIKTSQKKKTCHFTYYYSSLE
jgi:hypothetical protein